MKNIFHSKVTDSSIAGCFKSPATEFWDDFIVPPCTYTRKDTLINENKVFLSRVQPSLTQFPYKG